MKRKVLASVVLGVLLGQSYSAFALGLIEAYQAALQNDPTYQSAVHDREAGEQYKALGRSNLLPNVAASYSANKNRADYTFPGFLGQETTTHPQYRSHSSVVQLRQPLLNLDGYARYRQGIAQSNYSEAQFSARAQDLLLRLVGAYADAKFAEDQLALSIIQRDTFAEQRAVNERMFKLGEGTKTDMLETQAKYDLAEAQLLEARDNLTNARNALAAIVGQDVNELDSLGDGFRVKPMEPPDFDAWRVLALEHNGEIVAQRYAVEAAAQEINKNRAGHAPRVDFIAALSKGKSETLTTLNQDSTTRSLGVQVNIPIYSGGAVSAGTTQAVANHEKAKSDLDAKTNQVLVELRKQYNLVLSSVSRIDALVKSVQSARALVTATQQSVKGGVRINLDVLNAQQQLYTAQRDLAQARYSYLLAYLRLRNAAGTLNAEDLNTVASYFVKGTGSATSAAVSGGQIDMLAESGKLATIPVRQVAAPKPAPARTIPQ
jgi:protease secretion system outer membrane protein